MLTDFTYRQIQTGGSGTRNPRQTHQPGQGGAPDVPITPGYEAQSLLNEQANKAKVSPWLPPGHHTGQRFLLLPPPAPTSSSRTTPFLLPTGAASSLHYRTSHPWFACPSPVPSPAGARNVLCNPSRKGRALPAWAITTQHVCRLEPLKRFTPSDWFPLAASCTSFLAPGLQNPPQSALTGLRGRQQQK